MKKKIISTTVLFLMLTALVPFSVSADTYAPASNCNTQLEITPRADAIRYQYKVINNVLYKRLYNYTTNKPLSGWTKA